MALRLPFGVEEIDQFALLCFLYFGYCAQVEIIVYDQKSLFNVILFEASILGENSVEDKLDRYRHSFYLQAFVECSQIELIIQCHLIDHAEEDLC